MKMRPIPRRFWIPLGIAWAATITALVLATVQRGEYNPGLAILTLTLVAVIWYTYFTYRSVHREPPAYLLLELEYDPFFESVSIKVQNPTERTLEVRLTLDVWVDGIKVTMDAFYSGNESKPVNPTQGFPCVVDLRPHFKIERNASNSPVSGAEVALVRLTASWRDALGDSGTTLPLYKHIEPQRGQHHDLVAPSEIARHFKGLPGF